MLKSDKLLEQQEAVQDYLAAQFDRLGVERQRDPDVSFASRSKTNDLRAAAEALYKDHRAAVLAAIKGAGESPAIDGENMTPATHVAPTTFPAPANSDEIIEFDADVAALFRKLETDDAPETNQQRRNRLSRGPAWRGRDSFSYEAENDGGVEIHIAGGANGRLNAQLDAMLSGL